MESEKVFIVIMNLRRELYLLPENYKRVNVTSAQSKDQIID